MDNAFQLDKSQVRAAFERAAQSYDHVAILQREVLTRMAQRLECINHSPKLVLDAGSGTGNGVPVLRQRYPHAKLIELDIAHNMLLTSRAKQRARDHYLQRLFRRQNWLVCADLERLPFTQTSVDMIWSNLALQWLNTPNEAFAECYRILKPEGLLIFSTFGPDTLKELHHAFSGLHGEVHVNRFIDMHDLGDALLAAQFNSPVMEMEKIILTYDRVHDVLRELKALGAHNAMLGRRHGLMGRKTWDTLLARYEAYRTAGKLPVSYEVVYGHAWKPAQTEQASTPWKTIHLTTAHKTPSAKGE